MDLQIEFVEINHQEAAEKLYFYPHDVALFYMNGEYFKPIKDSRDFLSVVANNLTVYQQTFES